MLSHNHIHTHKSINSVNTLYYQINVPKAKYWLYNWAKFYSLKAWKMCTVSNIVLSSDYRKNAVVLPSLLRNARFMDNSESLFLPKRMEFITSSAVHRLLWFVTWKLYVET